MLAVTACPNGIAHTYMAAEALTKIGDKLGLPTKVETNGSDGAKNVLTPEEIAACDGIIIAADKNVETARFDGKPVLFARVDDGIHKPEELIKKIAHGETPIYHAEAGAKTRQPRAALLAGACRKRPDPFCEGLCLRPSHNCASARAALRQPSLCDSQMIQPLSSQKSARRDCPSCAECAIMSKNTEGGNPCRSCFPRVQR